MKSWKKSNTWIKESVGDLLLSNTHVWFSFFMARRSKSPQRTCFQNGGSCGSSEPHASAYLWWSKFSFQKFESMQQLWCKTGSNMYSVYGRSTQCNYTSLYSEHNKEILSFSLLPVFVLRTCKVYAETQPLFPVNTVLTKGLFVYTYPVWCLCAAVCTCLCRCTGCWCNSPDHWCCPASLSPSSLHAPGTTEEDTFLPAKHTQRT